MKKISLALCMVGVLFSLCFAQTAVEPVKKSAVGQGAQKADESKTVKGKVESVSLADAAKGTQSEITVVGDSGEKNTFLVKTTTTIYDANWKATTLDKISKDGNVKVKYSTTKEGVNEALSVSVVK